MFAFKLIFSPFLKFNLFFDGGDFLEEKKGKMTVEEAGRKGGLRTSETHGEEFYSEIGRKGGQKVRRLV